MIISACLDLGRAAFRDPLVAKIAEYDAACAHIRACRRWPARRRSARSCECRLRQAPPAVFAHRVAGAYATLDLEIGRFAPRTGDGIGPDHIDGPAAPVRIGRNAHEAAVPVLAGIDRPDHTGRSGQGRSECGARKKGPEKVSAQGFRHFDLPSEWETVRAVSGQPQVNRPG